MSDTELARTLIDGLLSLHLDERPAATFPSPTPERRTPPRRLNLIRTRRRSRA